MFTGLIEYQGEVIENSFNGVANRLKIRPLFSDAQVGESIAVNGVCLTLLPNAEHEMAFDVSPETLKLTNLNTVKAGEYVNIERAMLATSRFGGHYVSGHVDTTAMLQSINSVGDYVEMIIGGFQACDILYLLPKGSITLDGVSLTINSVNENSISVLLVPHTLERTTFAQRKVGDYLNVEFDYLTRIVAHQLKVKL